jgi:hypothetical protein
MPPMRVTHHETTCYVGTATCRTTSAMRCSRPLSGGERQLTTSLGKTRPRAIDNAAAPVPLGRLTVSLDL